MKPAVQKHAGLTTPPRGRSAIVLQDARPRRRRRAGADGRGGGGRRRRLRPVQRQARVGAVGAQDHRPARGGGRRRADDVPADPHRHQPGARRVGRGARRRQRDLRADAQEPHPRREPLQRRQDLPQDQAVRRGGAAGRRRVRHRDGADGPGRQGLGRAVLADARRQVPRSRPPLRRHDRRATRRRSRASCSRSAWTGASPT